MLCYDSVLKLVKAVQLFYASVVRLFLVVQSSHALHISRSHRSVYPDRDRIIFVARFSYKAILGD